MGFPLEKSSEADWMANLVIVGRQSLTFAENLGSEATLRCRYMSSATKGQTVVGWRGAKEPKEQTEHADGLVWYRAEATWTCFGLIRMMTLETQHLKETVDVKSYKGMISTIRRSWSNDEKVVSSSLADLHPSQSSGVGS